MPHKSRKILEISTDKLRKNYQTILCHISPLKAIPVLKADAYGMGALEIARALLPEQPPRFAVAEIDEALEIKKLGLPVQILGDVLEDEIPEIVSEDIICPITSLSLAQALDKEAEAQGKIAEAQFLIDTGMGRLGIILNDAEELILQATKLKNIKFTGIYSHFPHAYNDQDFTNTQVAKFDQLLKKLKQKNIHFSEVHIANSDGLQNIKTSYKEPFNLVRTGLNLYGCFDMEGQRVLNLEEIITLKAKVVSIRELDAKETIGYGRTYTLKKKARIATIAIGYADGLPISLSNQGHFIFQGLKLPIVGRVSMDYSTVLLEDQVNLKEGDFVTCLGESISVADWAKSQNTITYDIICRLSQRIKRIYN